LFFFGGGGGRGGNRWSGLFNESFGCGDGGGGGEGGGGGGCTGASVIIESIFCAGEEGRFVF